MRGLRKYLTPFAPDQSGAVSVLYELGGLIAICDAGGCTGNVCGFDEPRWFEQKSALFSAGLRDMDAILGRDDRLVEKLVDAASKLDVKFVAIIGTPVPAVIGTDYKALGRMCEKKLNMPVITIDTDGMELYDVGEEKAWLELFRTFAEKGMIDKASERVKPNPDIEKKQGKIGVLGLTPQDISDLRAPKKIREYYQEKEGKESICYCMRENVCRSTYGLDNARTAGGVEKNIVVSPAALAAAKYLQAHEKVAWVSCPMLEGDKHYALAKKYMPNGTCGVITFGLKGGREEAVRMMDSLKMIAIVTHVADARSCVLHPASHTHRQMNDQELKEAGVQPDLIRFSVGIENIDDIIADLSQALEQV